MIKPKAFYACLCLTVFFSTTYLHAQNLKTQPIVIDQGDVPSARDRQHILDKLNTTIIKEFKDQSLESAFALIAKQCDINMNVNWIALNKTGYKKNLPIAMTAENIRASELLDCVVDIATGTNWFNLIAWDINNNCVNVSVRYRIYKQKQIMIYDVKDLIFEAMPYVEDDQEKIDTAYINQMTEILEIIRTHAGFQSDWYEFGGDIASVRGFHNKLIVKAHPNIQSEVYTLLSKLRNPTPSEQETDAIRNKKMSSMLEKVISVQFEKVSLLKALEYVAQQSDVQFNIQWKDLDEIGIKSDIPISLSINDSKASDILQMVLDQATTRESLAYEQTKHTIDIASKRYLYRKHAYVKSYNIHHLTNETFKDEYDVTGLHFSKEQQKKDHLNRLLNLFRATTQEHYWTENGGDVATMKILNGQLIVKAHYDIHQNISKLLKTISSEAPSPQSGCK